MRRRCPAGTDPWRTSFSFRVFPLRELILPESLRFVFHSAHQRFDRIGRQPGRLILTQVSLHFLPGSLGHGERTLFLPAGTGGPFTVRVIAANVAGDGVPENGDITDQDFALIVYNVPEPDFTLSATPAYAPRCGPGAITYTVSVDGLYSYPYTVSLVHSTAPPTTGIALLPSSGVPSYDAALVVTTTGGTPSGLYTVIITGTGEVTRVAGKIL